MTNLHGSFFDVHVKSAQDVRSAFTHAIALAGVADKNGFRDTGATRFIVCAAAVNGWRRWCGRLRCSDAVHHVFRHPVEPVQNTNTKIQELLIIFRRNPIIFSTTRKTRLLRKISTFLFCTAFKTKKKKSGTRRRLAFLCALAATISAQTHSTRRTRRLMSKANQSSHLSIDWEIWVVVVLFQKGPDGRAKRA